jgi:hypothetical protein
MTFPSCNNKFLMIQQLVTSLDYLLTDCLKNKLILLKLEPIKHKNLTGKNDAQEKMFALRNITTFLVRTSKPF